MYSSPFPSLFNLRGIPKSIRNALHRSKIRILWNEFYKKFENLGRWPTRDEVLKNAKKVDDEFGDQFNPPVR